MSDESSKTMMVDERQSVRQVLDSLLDKSHCGYSPDWALVETITELQMGMCSHLLVSFQAVVWNKEGRCTVNNQYVNSS